MALSLKNFRLPSSGTSNSWTDFYINVTNQQLARSFQIKKQLKKQAGKQVAGLEFIITAADAWWFANVITDEYDKLIKNGKTLIGGVAVESGNKRLMALLLTRLLISTQKNPKGDLLLAIGPAVLAYWTGAKLKKFPAPTMPCIGSVKNINTITALALFPGVWSPSGMGPQGSNGPFLLNFILSAAIHLLTVGGFFSCNCQYPPPAPPAPGMLPWVGYFVKPFSGKPLSGINFKKLIVLIGGGVVTVTALVALAKLLNTKKKNKKKSLKDRERQLNQIFPPSSSPKEYRDAMNAILDEDEEAMAAAGVALGKLANIEPINREARNNTSNASDSNNTIGPKNNLDITDNKVPKVGIGLPLLGTAVTAALLIKKKNDDKAENEETGSLN